jgi:FPC/CPF motif-containing protein YcgG
MNATALAEPELKNIKENFKHFIENSGHPCIMAKSVFKMENYHMRAYDDMEDPADLQQLLSDLKQYLENYDFDGHNFETFLAVFPQNKFDDEISFEKSLWNTLQKLHELDDQQWDPRVSNDPENENFSFSLGGRAFYIIGMHPKSSRLARQAPYPTFVFNLHHQFEKLRGMGTYETVRDTIRQNDANLQGEINPVLRDFGEDSEARQYSGRNVEKNWTCPFHHS